MNVKERAVEMEGERKWKRGRDRQIEIENSERNGVGREKKGERKNEMKGERKKEMKGEKKKEIKKGGGSWTG